MIESCNHSTAKLCGSCMQKNHDNQRLSEAYAEVDRLRDIILRAKVQFRHADMKMDGSFRPVLSIDAMRRAYDILSEVDIKGFGG